MYMRATCPEKEEKNTYCHACGALLIERHGLELMGNRLREGKCPACGIRIDGVGM